MLRFLNGKNQLLNNNFYKNEFIDDIFMLYACECRDNVILDTLLNNDQKQKPFINGLVLRKSDKYLFLWLKIVTRNILT